MSKEESERYVCCRGIELRSRDWGGGVQKGDARHSDKKLTLCDCDCMKNTIPANGTRSTLGMPVQVSKALPNSAP